MKNNSFVYWVLAEGCLVSGIFTGGAIKDCAQGKKNLMSSAGGVIIRHDTIKTSAVEYRIIPGTIYNVDSLLDAVNQAWKDSLKGLYGKGLFEAKFSKEDNLGKREITFASRIPVDPEAELTFDEQLKLPEVYPKRTLGILAGLNFEIKNSFAGSVGLKYYILDFRNFALTGILEGKYYLNDRTWHPAARVETSLSF